MSIGVQTNPVGSLCTSWELCTHRATEFVPCPTVSNWIQMDKSPIVLWLRLTFWDQSGSDRIKKDPSIHPCLRPLAALAPPSWTALTWLGVWSWWSYSWAGLLGEVKLLWFLLAQAPYIYTQPHKEARNHKPQAVTVSPRFIQARLYCSPMWGPELDCFTWSEATVVDPVRFEVGGHWGFKYRCIYLARRSWLAHPLHSCSFPHVEFEIGLPDQTNTLIYTTHASSVLCRQTTCFSQPLIHWWRTRCHAFQWHPPLWTPGSLLHGSLCTITIGALDWLWHSQSKSLATVWYFMISSIWGTSLQLCKCYWGYQRNWPETRKHTPNLANSFLRLVVLQLVVRSLFRAKHHVVVRSTMW